MKRTVNCLMGLLLIVSLMACGGGGERHDPNHDDHNHTDGHAGHDHGDEHAGHDHGDEHAGHDHGEKHEGHTPHGKRVALGEADIGGFNVSVAAYGQIEAGGEGVLDVMVTGDKSPHVVRVWIGVESAQGSRKSKLGKTDTGFHGHVEAPDPLPADSAVWIQVQDDSGKKSSGSFAFK